jgi:hypothetical protein
VQLSLREHYARYRTWASHFGTGSGVVIGAAAAGVAALVLAFAGRDGRVWIFHNLLPWFALLGAPIAAFDAWGAAVWRGRPREGAVRALVIIALMWGVAAWAWTSNPT